MVSEKKNAIRQGIMSSDSCTINCMKLRINAGVTRDKAIADAYGNKFIIPLDFENVRQFGTLLQSRTRKQTML